MRSALLSFQLIFSENSSDDCVRFERRCPQSWKLSIFLVDFQEDVGLGCLRRQKQMLMIPPTIGISKSHINE